MIKKQENKIRNSESKKAMHFKPYFIREKKLHFHNISIQQIQIS